MKKYLSLTFIALSLSGFAQHDSLRAKINRIARSSKGTVEVAIKYDMTGDTLSVNGTLHAPMQSVFKFPIALTVLGMVDKGSLSFEQPVHLSKSDMDTNTWSPLSKKYGKRDTDLSLAELLNYMIVESDNVACDKLIKLAGGPEAITNHIHDLGINGIQIKYTEAEMHADPKAQYSDWCEAADMVRLLELFYRRKCLAVEYNVFLEGLMEKSKTGDKKIKGLLPKGTTVEHKSGWSGVDKKGLTAASNDIGVITLPSGYHLLIAVFVTNAMANTETIDLTIAKIARAAYDEFAKKQKK